MQRRPIPEQIRQWLSAEVEAWRTGGILTADQPARILDLYETSGDAAQRRQSLAVYALSSVAALMIGLAALLLVSYNWQAMPAAAKLTVIFGVLAGSYAVGFWLRYGAGWRLTSEIVLFLSSLLYGSAIWLIAQIFNIQSHYPDGIWFWALGVLPLALCLDTVLMHVLYVALLALWTGTEILGFPGMDPWLFGGFYVAHGALTLPLLALPGIVWAYRRQSPLTIALYAPLLAWWVVLQPVAWRWEVNTAYFVGMAGVLLLLIAAMHREGSLMAKPYRFCGLLIAGGVLIPLSYADFLVNSVYYEPAGSSFVAGWVIGLVAAAAVLGVVLLQRRYAAADGRMCPVAAILLRQWLPLALIVLLVGLCFWNGAFSQYEHRPSRYDYGAHDAQKWSPQILTPFAAVNVAMIALALWLMRLGAREDRTWPFAAGVLYFLLWALLRYIDLFSGVGGMLGAALMFLLCGVGLFAVARFWIHRKETLSSPFARGAGDEGGQGARGQGSEVSDTMLSINNQQSTINNPPPSLTLTLSQRERGSKLFLMAGCGLQLTVLVGMIVGRMILLWTGEPVLLRVVPVDPRDMFRGDYVTLSYDFSRIQPQGIVGLPSNGDNYDTSWQGKTVYVTLVPEEDGKHWRADKYTVERPTSGKFIRGTLGGWRNIEYGIESFYVEEGQGKQYEQAVRDRKLSAEVVVAADGQAALRNLQISAEPGKQGATERPTYDAVEQYRSPSDTTYRVVRVPDAEMRLDGRLDEPEWSRANVERHFTFPWKKANAPATEFSAFCDDQYLYFGFRVEDSDIVVLDKLRDKEDEVFEDRVEFYYSRDNQMKDYYCLEIDSRGRVLDYRGKYYRQLDMKWHCEGVKAAGATTPKGYTVEGRIPLARLEDMGLYQQMPGRYSGRILFGIYRAEFSHDRGGKPVAERETIHNQGRKLDGPSPIEEWISWIDPMTPEPDFHVPSSLGWLEIVEQRHYPIPWPPRTK